MPRSNHGAVVLDVGKYFNEEDDDKQIPDPVLNGQCSIIFAHPKAPLSMEGHKLMADRVVQENTAACVIDEAHCVQLW